MASATIFHYALLLGVASGLYLVFILITDVFGGVQSLMLSIYPQFITQQTIVSVNFVTGIVVASPFLVALIIFIWAIVRGASN